MTDLPAQEKMSNDLARVACIITDCREEGLSSSATAERILVHLGLRPAPLNYWQHCGQAWATVEPATNCPNCFETLSTIQQEN